MEYLIITGAQLFGVFFHNMLKLLEIHKRRHDDSLPEEIAVFYSENIFSLVLSGGILLFMLFVHWVVDRAGIGEHISYFHYWYYFFSLILGYQGQKLMYKLLDKGSEFVDKKIDEKLK